MEKTDIELKIKKNMLLSDETLTGIRITSKYVVFLMSCLCIN